MSAADGEPAGHDLQVRDEPFRDWQKLAWAGVFLITLGVLVLNILARTLFRQPDLDTMEARLQ